MKNQVAYVAGEVLVAILAIIGNSLVVFVFFSNARLRSFRNYYILGLAIADFLMGTIAIPLAILASFGLPKNLYGCLITCCTILVCCAISIFCLLAVSVDRFWATANPITYYKHMNAKKSCGIIVSCAFFGTIVGLSPLFGWYNPHGWDWDGEKMCKFTRIMDYDFLAFYYFVVIIFPAILMACFYAYIYRFIRILIKKKRLARRNALQPGDPEPSEAEYNLVTFVPTTKAQNERAKRKEARAGQKLSSIIIFFLVCWLPLNTLNCIKAFYPAFEVPFELIQFTIILSHVKSAVNPLLYAYHLQEFRKAMKYNALQILEPITCGTLKNLTTDGNNRTLPPSSSATNP